MDVHLRVMKLQCLPTLDHCQLPSNCCFSCSSEFVTAVSRMFDLILDTPAKLKVQSLSDILG